MSLQDIRQSLRTMAAQPLFTSMAALSLALGIGANTAIFSFMDSILLRSLPVQNPESLVVLNWHTKSHPVVAHRFSGSTHTDARTGYTSGNVPYPVFALFRENKAVFSSVFAFRDAGRLTLQLNGHAEVGAAQYISGEFFRSLGVPPAAGRLIDGTDDAGGAPPVAVTSYAFAVSHFGDVAKAVGQSLLINDSAFTVVGVASPEFYGVNPEGAPVLYVPMHTDRLIEKVFLDELSTKYIDGNFYWVEIMGRLRPGVSREQAGAVVAPLFHHFIADTAHTAEERADLPVMFLREGAGGLDSLRRQYSKPLYVLMTLVAFILAIACANIANLLLARAAARRREIAVRLSLGAGRWRLIRQLLTESVMLAVLGGCLGLAFAQWGIRALTLLLANGRDNFTLHAALNWHVLLVTMALSITTGILFGLAPAIQSTRVDLVTALKQTRAGESPRLRGWMPLNMSQVLAVGQIAISLLLLIAAGLFLRTLSNLNSITLGFNRENLLLFGVNARQAGYKDDALMRFYADLQNRLAAIPGVRSATLSAYPLVAQHRSTTNIRVPGETSAKKSTDILNVGSGFFNTMQIPILLGREIEEGDMFSPRHVAVVNEVFVKTYLGAGNPIGRHIELGGDKDRTDCEVIGVARNSRLSSLKSDIPAAAYLPYAQNPRFSSGQMTYELRAAGNPAGLAASVREVVRQADPRIPVTNVLTQTRQIDETIGQERTFAMLCTCFALLAVGIACVGLYGMMAYRVARRTQEIGIRLALGAERRRLIWMVQREVLTLAGIGLAIGVPVALAASRVLQSFLFQMKPNDPLTLGIAPVLLVAAALLAGYGPAWRAARVDPCVALRDE
ncbi:MAG TPA: ABC transporter permease [Bryobacteraceae bacterium]|nr:ABC transporter permease [Bryobacteraceae bacterium]